jgi:hypothetical protein
MSRHPDHGFDPRIADWLEADPNLAPPDVLRTVESAIPSIPQRRVMRLPWRYLPMNRLVILGATGALIAVLGVGAWTVSSRPPAPAAAPGVTPAATVPSAAASVLPAVTALEYVAARDKVCQAAVAAAAPIKARYEPLYAADSTEAQRSAAIAAVREFADFADGFVDELEALEAPPELIAEHAAAVANYRDILILIRESLALHDQGRTAEALAVDLATDGIAAQINAFERRHGLTPCP